MITKYLHCQKGSALFLILIAVALFAALSYAVTQSGRGGGSIDREEANLKASQIIQYASLVSQTIQRLQLVNGCSDTEISIEYPSGTNVNSVSTLTDNRCHLFESDGGGLTYVEPAVGDPWVFNSSVAIGLSSDPTPHNAELTLIIPNVPTEVCHAINDVMGIEYSGSTVPSGLNSFDTPTTQFTGTYVNNDALGTTVWTDAELVGFDTFCFREQSTDDLFFVHLLLDRT